MHVLSFFFAICAANEDKDMQQRAEKTKPVADNFFMIILLLSVGLEILTKCGKILTEISKIL